MQRMARRILLSLVTAGLAAGSLLAAPASARAHSGHDAPPAATRQPGYRVGQAVEILWNGNWYPGRVLAVQGAQYRITYDGYASSWDEWVAADRLRGAGGAASASSAPAARPSGTPPAGAAAATWRPGERVEAYVDGAWHSASVLRVGTGAEAGQVRVTLDGYTYGTSRMEWVAPSHLRRPARTQPRPAAAAQGLPAALPAGLYVCTTSYTTQTATSLMTIGRMRLRADGTYTGISRDGTGGGGRYRYSAATGTVEWIGGLRGFSGIPTGTRVTRDPRAGILITVSYQVRAGGSEYSLECAREAS